MCYIFRVSWIKYERVSVKQDIGDRIQSTRFLSAWYPESYPCSTDNLIIFINPPLIKSKNKIMNLKILFFGDIVGKIGRQALAKVLPELKKEYSPDLIIANAENLAHGKGVTNDSLKSMMEAGIDFFTSGNHIWKKKEALPILQENKLPIIRPANYPPQVPGVGYKIIEVGSKKVLIINLVGRVFMKEDFDCPFRQLDEILAKTKKEKPSAVIIDFHAEATSEKRALNFYASGQVSAVIGTHTHIQTADEEISKDGTAYITDVGMVAAKDSILGSNKQDIIKKFLTQLPAEHEIPESGPVIVNAVYLEINPQNGQATQIKRLNQEVEIN